MKIFVCTYRRIGRQVLEHLVSHYDKDDIAVFTHKGDDAVKNYCEEQGVWYTFENVSKAELPFNPDVVASVYYSYIIKEHIIDLCDGKIFNVHPSLLPNHRGCSAVPWAMINGDAITGVTIHYIDKNIDTGKIILQVSTQIEDIDTQLSLYNRMMDLGAQMWPAALNLVLAGFTGIEQHGSLTQYHRRGCPYEGKIDDSWDRERIERFIKAMDFPPLPPASYKGKEVRTIEEFDAVSDMHK